jgi:hypothetical protein
MQRLLDNVLKIKMPGMHYIKTQTHDIQAAGALEHCYSSTYNIELK